MLTRVRLRFQMAGLSWDQVALTALGLEKLDWNRLCQSWLDLALFTGLGSALGLVPLGLARLGSAVIGVVLFGVAYSVG